MKRIQLFEFEDFEWFPDVFRSTMTKILAVLQRLIGTKEVVGNLLNEIRQRKPFTRIVDMGSGSGGIMPGVVEFLNDQGTAPVELILTDLHPNKKITAAFNGRPQANVSYLNVPLDASDLSKAPKGLKTMMNSFHHMPPETARKILATAQENREPILIYEMGVNNIPTILWAISTPIALPLIALTAILLVPFVKPLNWKDLLFSWLIPVVPLFYAWDGHASLPRMYTFEDINSSLLPGTDLGYEWELGKPKKGNGKEQGYYILGLPK